MRAITLPTHGGPEVLTLAEVDDPVPGPDEVLVRVAHSAMNRADTLQRQGGYPDPVRRSVEIPGLEFAGTVAAVGERVTRWALGDRVMGIEAGACHAELVVTHERQALPVPSTVDLADAAAIPEVFLTAWDALVVQGGLTSGRWALVHAGGSGVGTAAIQLAKAIGARIAVTCSAGKAEACRALGADLVLERSPADWAAALRSAVPEGVDVVLDVIGGEEADRNLQVVRPQGTIVQVGLMGGARTPVTLGLLLVKRVTWIGTTLRARPLEQKIAICQRFAAEVLPLFESGALRPVIDTRFPLERIADAHRYMEADANVGKILLDVAPTA
jgi:putative PIG3 family NAD(P)H quinone oxidoreductase